MSSLSLLYTTSDANNFSGNVPASLGNLVNLIYLDLGKYLFLNTYLLSLDVLKRIETDGLVLFTK